MRKFYSFLLSSALLFSGTAVAQNFVQIGTGSSVTGNFDTGPTPFGTYYEDDRTQILFTAAELLANGASPGDILQVGFDVVSPGSPSMGSFNLKMKMTTATSLSTFETGATTVYSSASYTPTSGWNDFTLTTPFNWDGVSNLIVETCFDNSAWGSNTTVRYSSTSFNSVYSYYCDSWCNTGGGCFNTNTSTFYAYQERANTRFEFAPPVANDAGVTAINTPTLPACSVDSNLTITLNNIGQDSLTSATINWSVNGMAQTPVNWTGVVPAQGGNLGPITVGTYNFQSGDQIMVWTSMPNGVQDSVPQNDTARFTAGVSMNGMYTIDASGSGATNFLSFTDAVAELSTKGVCGPVTFNVADGTYNEQIEFDPILGASAMNTITFQSATGDTSACILEYGNSSGTTDNYVVQVNNGAEYIRFHEMQIRNQSQGSFSWNTYARVFNFAGASAGFEITDCRISNTAGATTSTNIALIFKNGPECHECVVSGNTFVNGSYGLYWYGSNNAYDEDNEISDNTILESYYMGASIYYQDGLDCSRNEITSNSTYTFGYALRLYYNTGPTVNENFIHTSPGANWPRYGIYIFDLQGDLQEYAQIHGNRVGIGDPNYNTNYYGIYMSQGIFGELAHNTVLLKNGTTTSRGIYLIGGSFNFLFNNIGVNGADGHGVYISGNAVYESDHNVFHSANGSMGYWNTNYNDLSSWQQGTGEDANSIAVTNIFADSNSLKVCTDSLDGAGTPIAGGLAYDFEGDMRDANTPDIGADEFASASNFDMVDTVGLCNGDTLILEAFYFDSVVWNTNTVSPTFMVTTPATYTVDVYGLCGQASDQIVVLPQEEADLGISNNICFNGSTVLDPGVVGGTYNWSTNETTQTITVNAPGNYTVTVMDRFGCMSTATSAVTQSVPVDLPDTVEFCEGGAATLDANMPGNYDWSSGQNSQSIQVMSAGPYTVTVTDPFNCVTEDETEVVEVLNPIVGFGTQTTFLTIEFSDSSQNATGHFWDFGDGTTSSSASPTHVFPWPGGTFTVIYTVSNQCGSASDTITVSVDEDNTTGIQDVGAQASVQVYPNPSNGIFQIAVEGSVQEDIRIEVLDLKGQLILDRNLGVLQGTLRDEIDLGNAAQGVYLMKLYVGNEVATQLLTVQ